MGEISEVNGGARQGTQSGSLAGKGLLLAHVRTWPAGQVKSRQDLVTESLAGTDDCTLVPALFPTLETVVTRQDVAQQEY